MPTNVKRLSRFEKPGQYTKADREKINKGSFAGPHQSFPIVTQQDVYDAARLVGHAANPAAVRRRIIAIANRKGFKLPKSWQDKDEEAEEKEWPKKLDMGVRSVHVSQPLTKQVHAQSKTKRTLSQIPPKPLPQIDMAKQRKKTSQKTSVTNRKQVIGK